MYSIYLWSLHILCVIKKRMKILAIYPVHNSNVGIYEDGKCLCIYHEEKFNNKKNHLGWPHRALKYLSQRYDFKTFDYVVITSEQQFYFPDDRKIEEVRAQMSTSMGKITTKLKDWYYYLWYRLGNHEFFKIFLKYCLHKLFTPGVKKQMEETLLSEHGIEKEKILYVEHHLGHCMTPFYFYGLADKKKDLLIITVDGEGDDYCSRIYHYNYKNKEFKVVAESSFEASVGLLYLEVTRFLGMKPAEHEYKVMGLAAYVSDPKYYQSIYDKFAKIIWLDEETLSFKTDVSMFVSVMYWLRDNITCERFDNVAAAVQKFTEDMVIKYVKLAIERTGVKTVVFSGGVFMNVKLNQKLMEMPEVGEAYFQPSCGDESSTIGNCAKIFIDHGVKLKPIKTMFLGHQYSNEQVNKFLKVNKYLKKYQVTFFEKNADLYREIVRLLKNFEIVGVFRGAGEWGARSLGNRTILGNSSDLKTFYTVNNMIKMRDFWMPFAPTILEEWAPKYVKNWEVIKKKSFDSTKYMVITFDSTELAQEHLRAAIHQKDKTMRPQILSESDNPDMYQLLKLYEKETGMGGLLNTSMNIHGYPLVGTLEQAMFTLENSGLKYLALENYLISKS